MGVDRIPTPAKTINSNHPVSTHTWDKTQEYDKEKDITLTQDTLHRDDVDDERYPLFEHGSLDIVTVG